MKTHVIHDANLIKALTGNNTSKLIIVRIEDKFKLASYLSEDTKFELIMPLDYKKTLSLLA